MEKNKLLYDTRKIYNKIKKLMIKNGLKGQGSWLYYYRLLKARKIIIKWYYRNNYSLLMLELDNLDFTINYGLKHYIDHHNDENIEHIFKLVNRFNNMAEQIEDYYNG